MTLHGAIEAVQLKGAALQSAWPFDLDNVNQRPPEEAFDQAMRYKGMSHCYTKKRIFLL